jgi:Mor family transcriptional regulator
MDKSVEENETLEQLELLIGKENALKVVKFFEGSNIYFPKSIGLHKQHEQIFAELRKGASYAQVAWQYGYTKAYIRKIEYKKRKERRKEPARPVAGVAHSDEPAKLNLKDITVKQGELFHE